MNQSKTSLHNFFIYIYRKSLNVNFVYNPTIAHTMINFNCSWKAYPNDPLNCFFAELMSGLEGIAAVNSTGALGALLDTVTKRRDYLHQVFTDSVFESSILSSHSRETTGHLIGRAIEIFNTMIADIGDIDSHSTIVERVRRMHSVLQRYVKRQTTLQMIMI